MGRAFFTHQDSTMSAFTKPSDLLRMARIGCSYHDGTYATTRTKWLAHGFTLSAYA